MLTARFDFRIGFEKTRFRMSASFFLYFVASSRITCSWKPLRALISFCKASVFSSIVSLLSGRLGAFAVERVSQDVTLWLCNSTPTLDQFIASRKPTPRRQSRRHTTTATPLHFTPLHRSIVTRRERLMQMITSTNPHGCYSTPYASTQRRFPTDAGTKTSLFRKACWR
jgi:hypothetical protein